MTEYCYYFHPQIWIGLSCIVFVIGAFIITHSLYVYSNASIIGGALMFVGVIALYIVIVVIPYKAEITKTKPSKIVYFENEVHVYAFNQWTVWDDHQSYVTICDTTTFYKINVLSIGKLNDTDIKWRPPYGCLQNKTK